MDSRGHAQCGCRVCTPPPSLIIPLCTVRQKSGTSARPTRSGALEGVFCVYLPRAAAVVRCGAACKQGLFLFTMMAALVSAAATLELPPAWYVAAPRTVDALTPPQLAAAVAHRDRSGRLQALLSRLVAGEPLEFAVVGGSVSAGSTLGIHRREGLFLWHGRLLQWLNHTYPDAAHRRVNGAVPASTPAYVEGCLSFHVPPTAQLIFVEYSVNTPEPREYERLLRRLLRYPRRPPIILLHMFKFWPNKKMRGFDYSKEYVDASDLDIPYAAPIEEAATAMAKHYDGVSAISMRGALFDVVRQNQTDGLRLRDLMLDRIHPSDSGQLVAARLVASFLGAEIEALRSRAAATASTTTTAMVMATPSARSLRAPYFRNNADDQFSNTVVCVRGEDMLQHTLRMDGWRYAVEGTASNPKPGLRANAAGAQLDFCWRPAPRDFDRSVSFKLGYLKTYNRQFGPALLTCSGICECKATTLSGGAVGRPKRINGRDRTSLHHVENVVLRPTGGSGGGGPGFLFLTGNATTAKQMARARRRSLLASRHNTRLVDVAGSPIQAPASNGSGGVSNASCCIVTVRTLPNVAVEGHATASSAFKVLSFFVGKGAAGTGRLHQQSIVLAGTT